MQNIKKSNTIITINSNTQEKVQQTIQKIALSSGKVTEKYLNYDDKNKIEIETLINMVFKNLEGGGKFFLQRIDPESEDDKVTKFRIFGCGAVATLTCIDNNGKLEINVDIIADINDCSNSGIKFVDSLESEIRYTVQLFDGCTQKKELYDNFSKDDSAKYDSSIGIKCYKICESCDEIIALINKATFYTESFKKVCSEISDLISPYFYNKETVDFKSVCEMCDLFEKLRHLNEKFLSETATIKIKKLKDYISKCFNDFNLEFQNLSKEKRENLILRYFFTTLRQNKLTYVTGSEAVWMKIIYKNALEKYPRFARLSQEKRNDLMYQAFLNGKYTEASRDINFYAMQVFYVFYINGITDEVEMYDDNIQKKCLYKKISEENKRILYIGGFAKTCAMFITYEYTVNRLRTSMNVQDLWKILTLTKYSE